jgi:hypothetical protein
MIDFFLFEDNLSYASEYKIISINLAKKNRLVFAELTDKI